jgi:hypothetical protein
MLAGTVAIAAVATALALPRRRSMLAPPRGLLLAVAAGVPLLVGAWLVLWNGTYDDPFTRVGLRCFTLTALSAPWPFVALATVARRIDPTYPRSIGAALGAAAGAWAAAMIELWCPLSAPSHVAVGHVLPLVVLVAAGAAAGARIFRAREA